MITEVSPVIICPPCLKDGMKQHCLDCEIRTSCTSPRGLCVREYPNHKLGCPNYGKRKTCPPYVQMFDSVYNLSRPVYAIYNVFGFKSHVDRMREKHPDWSQRQLECCLYWQSTARKQLKEKIEAFKKLLDEHYQGTRYSIILTPEAMGVNVTETMWGVGIKLEWPPVNVAYQIAFAAIRRKNDQTIQSKRS